MTSFFLWFQWVQENYILVGWIIAGLLGFLFGGWKFALALLTLGMSHISYKAGVKKTEKEIEVATKTIKEKREKAYAEIDANNLDRNAVVERLRKGSY